MVVQSLNLGQNLYRNVNKCLIKTTATQHNDLFLPWFTRRQPPEPTRTQLWMHLNILFYWNSYEQFVEQIIFSEFVNLSVPNFFIHLNKLNALLTFAVLSNPKVENRFSNRRANNPLIESLFIYFCIHENRALDCLITSSRRYRRTLIIFARASKGTALECHLNVRQNDYQADLIS